MSEWNKAIEAAASVLDDWEQGMLEMVNSGDATMREIRQDVLTFQTIKRDILRLKTSDEDGK